MPRIEHLSRSEAWQPDADTVTSFQHAAFTACRVLGPARLVRLLCHAGVAPEGQTYGANRQDGSFWFTEDQFHQLRAAAIADLRSQGGGSERDRLRAYLRLQLRDVLAVRRDWTPSFDYFAVLAIPDGKAAVALMGKIAGQPVYDPSTYAGQQSSRQGVFLAGGLTQYVIDFRFKANSGLERCIQGPFGF